MKGKGKLTQIYMSVVLFILFKGEDRDLSDAEITAILKILGTCHPYLAVFIAVLQIVLKVHSVKHFIHSALKKLLLKFC